MEQDATGSGPGGVGRSQNVVHVQPHDWASIAQTVGPLLERIDPSVSETQLVIATADAEAATAVAASLVRLALERGIRIVAATSSRRADRLLRVEPPHVLAGSPETLLELIRGTAARLAHVRAIVIAWADELIGAGGAPSLETLMGDLPKDAARTIVTSELTAAVDELIERYARRARREVTPSTAADQPTTIEYLSVTPPSRLPALRRVLDELDPGSAVVFTRSDASEIVARELLHALGYAGAGATVRTARVAPPGTEIIILYDLPGSRAELREAVVHARRVLALVQPRQVSSLRALAAGGTVAPLALPDAAQRARSRDEVRRDELRAELAAGEFGRELLALEPLLDEYDGIEIAAVAMRLLERERSSRATTVRTEPRSSETAATSGSMARLFINVGSRDSIRPGDLVGAIVNEGGVMRSDVGKVDVRESHSLVEVAAGSAAMVVEKLTGKMIRGRRAIARIDTERPSRAPRERGADRFSRPDRPPRGPDRRRDRA